MSEKQKKKNTNKVVNVSFGTFHFLSTVTFTNITKTTYLYLSYSEKLLL